MNEIPPECLSMPAQLSRVYRRLVDGKEHSRQEIADYTGDPVLSVTARIRELRNKHGYTILCNETFRVNVFVYRMVL